MKLLAEILAEVKFPLLERIVLNLDNFDKSLPEYFKAFILFPSLRSIGLTNVTLTFNNNIDLTSFKHAGGFEERFERNPNVERINMGSEFNVQVIEEFCKVRKNLPFIVETQFKEENLENYRQLSEQYYNIKFKLLV